MSLAFDQAMQDLSSEIRKIIPADLSLESKQNDASFLLELTDIYKKSESIVLNTLITELFGRAGKQWSSLLQKIDKSNSVAPAQEESATEVEVNIPQNANKKQVYRGQDVSTSSQEKSSQEKPKRKQYYRGSAV